MNDHDRPPGSLLGCLAGAVAGAATAAVLLVLVLAMVAASQEGWQAAAGATAAAGPALVPTALLGGLVGFVVIGHRTDNRTVANIFSAARILTPGAVAVGFGVVLGVVGYSLLWLREHPGASVLALPDHVFTVARSPTAAFSLFVTAGLFAGIIGGIYLVGRGRARAVGRTLTTAGLGALAGLTIFTVASILTAEPKPTDGDAVLQALAAAVYSGSPVEWLMVLAAATAGLALSRYAWQTYGILTFVALLFVVLGYLTYTTAVTFPTVPPGNLWFSVLLFAAEILSMLMVLLYSFYTLDVAARKQWRRTPKGATFSPFYQPKVAFHVATFNEPPEMVHETLRRLLAMDYPPDEYVIMVGDDSTDEESRRPLEAFCKQHGILYLHRKDRRGFKAGALNELLKRTPEDYNLIAVVDADYQVEPDFVRETAGYFVDPALGWLQTPQDYRNRHQSFLTEQYYLADAYFYRAILPSRNEENSIIFCGTMGVLRARALRLAGGWAEDHITEDAELSTRLLNAGWRSLYINKTYGRGLIPATFEGYKKQHYRWAAGGGRILRQHGLRLLFGRYTFRQRLDNLMGTFTWLEGVFIFGIALLVMGLGVGELVGSRFVTHHDREIALLGLVPVFLLLDGVTRVHMVLRSAVHVTAGGTVRIIGMWFSVKFSNMRAALKGLFGVKTPFVRTPKAPTATPTRREAIARAIRLTRFESSLAVVTLVLAVTMIAKAVLVSTGDWHDADGTPATLRRVFLATWLTYYFFAFFAAPLYAYKSYVTLKPDPQPDPQPEPRRVPSHVTEASA